MGQLIFGMEIFKLIISTTTTFENSCSFVAISRVHMSEVSTMKANILVQNFNFVLISSR
jgi:hypothetical protein